MALIPTGFVLTPGSAAVLQSQNVVFTITLTPPGSQGTQAFTLSDGGSGGTFTPASATVPNGSNSVTFTYSNPNAGAVMVTVAPSGGALTGVNPQGAVVTVRAGSGAGISTGQAGGNMAGAIQNYTGTTFAKGFLFGNNPSTGINNDVPFGVLQNFTLKNTLGLKELMGPEGVVALAAGASDRKIVIDAQFAKINPFQYSLLMGGTLATVSAVASPTAGPTLTAAAGSTSYTAGYVAVGYSLTTQYGETLISPLTTVSLTAGQAIVVSSLGALPAGALSANLFASSQAYATTASASAASTYVYQNYAGGATTITAAPLTTARTPLTATNVTAASRVYTSSILDEPTAFSLQFQTPGQGGIDQDIKVYGLIVPDFEMDFKLKEFVIPKFTANCYGDPTQSGTVLMTIRQI